MKNCCILLGLIFLLFGCDDQKGNTPVSGKINIAADESFFPIVESEKNVYEYLYKNTKISLTSLPEKEALKQFVEGDLDVVVVSRELSEREKQILSNKKLNPESYPIAYDALVLITHKDRNDSSLTLSQLKDVLSGKIKSWKDLGGDGNDIVLAFDLNSSSNLLFIDSRFAINTEKANIFAAGSNLKVIEYVEQHKDAIGVIGLSWISGDPASDKHLKNIRVMGLKGEDGKIHLPWQDDIAIGKYPLKRNIFLINKYKTGLGTGFASYVIGEEGQRIILKAGLLPAKMPGRDVIFKKE